MQAFEGLEESHSPKLKMVKTFRHIFKGNSGNTVNTSLQEN